jgi:indolepyruvate ferredoxin oxidoreductase alpha subunit
LKYLLTGNEAVARGAYEAGVTVAAAYPGTPSTEILENIAPYKEIYAEWAPNEKVALEVAAGASIAGARALAAMKHVGVNVAADPLMTLAYTGVNGGLVLVSADDPGLHSSQNEQDNRYYAKFGKMALLEPSDSQEAKDFVAEAMKISEEFDVVVILRMTTRVCHSKSLVEYGQRQEMGMKPYVKQAKKYIATPANAKVLHKTLEERLIKLEDYSNKSPLNFIEWNDKKIGVVTSGISYQYAKEVFGSEVSYLKLGMTNPLPKEKIKEFASQVDTIYVVEENEPYLEEALKAMGIDCTGKDRLPLVGELNPDIVERALKGTGREVYTTDTKLPNRPPALCPGCPHRGLYYVLGRQKNAIITSDIGCYTLGSAPPLNAGDTCICMGASISAGHGMFKAFEHNKNMDKKIFSVIGDSTFFHSGMTGLLDVVYNRGNSTVIIADNRTTGMTGHQENPGTGRTLKGDPTVEADIAKICNAYGVKKVVQVNPLNLKEMQAAVKEATQTDETMVIVAKWPCALLKNQPQPEGCYHIDEDKCTKCKSCLKVGCPAIFNLDGKIQIDDTMCNGCGFCAQVCPFDAIEKVGE